MSEVLQLKLEPLCTVSDYHCDHAGISSTSVSSQKHFFTILFKFQAFASKFEEIVYCIISPSLHSLSEHNHFMVQIKF